MVQHYCAEEHRPAQFPEAIVVGLDEQLFRRDSKPKWFKVFFTSPFCLLPLMLPSSLLYFCSCALSVQGHGLMQNPYTALSKMAFAAIWICDRGEKSNFLLWAPSAKEKSTTLDRIFSFLMRPSCQYSLSPFRPGSSQMSFNFCFRTKEEILQRFKTSLQNILSHAATK